MSKKYFGQTKIIKRQLLALIFSLTVLTLATPVLAYNILENGGGNNTAITSGYTKNVYDPSTQSIEVRVGQILSAILSFLGVIFLLYMIYGGVMWMTARGNDSAIEKAKNIIVFAITGLLIVVAAYVITSFVLTSLGVSMFGL